MKYVLVENNRIVEGPRTLPINWRNISNFYVLDSETIKSHGFLPYRFVEVVLGDNEVYDGTYFDISENEVVEYQKKRQKTEQEIEKEIEEKWIDIRSYRNKLLGESDWTQLVDVSLSESEKLEWRNYRQELRDITNYPNPNDVIWPNKPLTPTNNQQDVTDPFAESAYNSSNDDHLINP